MWVEQASCAPERAHLANTARTIYNEAIVICWAIAAKGLIAVVCGPALVMIGCAAPLKESNSSEKPFSRREKATDILRTCTGKILADKRDPFTPTTTSASLAPSKGDFVRRPITVTLRARPGQSGPRRVWYQAESSVSAVSRGYGYDWSPTPVASSNHFGGRYSTDPHDGLTYRGIEIAVADDTSVRAQTTYCTGASGSLDPAASTTRIVGDVRLTCK